MSEITTREHDHEPVPGLPGELPDGEYIVWQGRPQANLVARRVLKVRWIAAYMLALAAWAVVAGVSDGRTPASIAFSAGVLIAMGAVLIGLLEMYASAVARGTLYTITNARLVMRIGVGLTVTLNLPFNRIATAAVRREQDGSGSIALVPRDGARLAWLVIWPHCRPWHYAQPQPSLICLGNVDQVARVLVRELAHQEEAADETAATRERGDGVPAKVAIAPSGAAAALATG